MVSVRDNLIAAFLSQYVHAKATASGRVPPSPDMIKAAIQVLIDEDVMTRDEIRLKALAEYDVFIPDDYFQEVQQ